MALGDTPLGETPIGAAGPMAILKEGGSVPKYGLVVVNDSGGAFIREYKITAAELASWNAAGAWSAGTHVGVTQAEWETGKCVLIGKNFDSGDMRVYPNGAIKMKFSEELVNGRIIERFCVLGPGEYSGTPPDITVSQAILDGVTYGDILGWAPPSTRIASILAGVVETK